MYKVFIDDIEADVNEVDINITYAISDFTAINASKSPKSDNISLPITATNKKIFGFNDQLGTDNYSPGTGRVEKNGIIKLFGTCKLLGISNTFNIQIIDGSIDWLTEIGESKLSDLDLSGLNHTFNYANIIAATSGNYIYPLIDYGFLSDDRWTKDMRPGISVEYLLEQILSDYTISSTMLAAGTGIADLYMSVNEPPDITELPDGSYSNYENTSVQSVYSDTVNGFTYIDETIDLEFPTAITESVLYKTVTGLEAFYIPGGLGNTYQFRYNLDVVISGSNITDSDLAATTVIRDDNGTAIDIQVTTGLTAPGTTAVELVTDTLWRDEASETGYYVEITIDGDITTSTSSAITMTVDSGANYEVVGFKSIGTGFSYSFDDTIPDIKQINFIKELRDRYNLYFYLDKNTDTLYLDSQDDFYPELGTYIDWSGKLVNDTLKQSLIKHPSEIEFKWAVDSNDRYLSKEEYVTGNTSIALTDGSGATTKKSMFGYTYYQPYATKFNVAVPQIIEKDAEYPFTGRDIVDEPDLYYDHPVKLWELSSGTQSGNWTLSGTSRTTFVKIISAEFPTSTYDTWVDMQENGRLITGMFNLSEVELSQLNEKLSNMFLTSWRIIEHKGMKHLCRINKVVTNPKTNQTKVELIWY